MIWENEGHRLDELVKFTRDIGFLEVFIYTNGTKPLQIKNCKYIVTVDGPKEVHNKIRNDSYDLVIENVKNAVTKAVYASITFSRANFKSLDEFVDELTRTQLFKGISFNLLTHWPEVIEKHGLSIEDRNLLLEKIWQLKNDGYPIMFSRAAYKALLKNDWKRPIPQVELGTREKIYKCCRDVDNPSICTNCGYVGCVEISQVLALKPSAIWQVFRMIQV